MIKPLGVDLGFWLIGLWLGGSTLILLVLYVKYRFEERAAAPAAAAEEGEAPPLLLSDGFPGGFPSDPLVEAYYRASDRDN